MSEQTLRQPTEQHHRDFRAAAGYIPTTRAEEVDELYYGGEGRKVQIDCQQARKRDRFAMARSKMIVKGRHRTCVLYQLVDGRYVRITQNDSPHGKRYEHYHCDYWTALDRCFKWGRRKAR